MIASERERARTPDTSHEANRLAARGVRCALISLPDNLDLAWWRTQCEEMDPRAAEGVKQKALVEGLSASVLQTYPELCITPANIFGLGNVSRVYVAHKGRIAWWHKAADVERCEREMLRTMDPAWAARMHPGAFYLWVFAVPLPVPEQWPVPQIVQASRLPYWLGWLEAFDGDYRPNWLQG